MQPAPTLVVCGSVHYDVIVQLPRFPRANDRLAPGAVTLAPGGMGGNVAAAFSRLGGHSRFVGMFSSDDDGVCLREDLERDGVDTNWSSWSGATGTRGFILVDGEAERAIIGYWSAIADLIRSPGQSPGPVEHSAPDRTTRRTRRFPHLVLRPEVFDAPVDAFSCPFNFAPVVLDTVPAHLPVYMDLETGHVQGWSEEDIRRHLGRATVIFGNQRNLSSLLDLLGETELASLAMATDTIFVETLGADGCAIHYEGMTTIVPGYPANPVDSTGAGDCFAAAFTLAHLQGRSLEESASFACYAAARSVRALGSRPGVPTAADMELLWTFNHPHRIEMNTPSNEGQTHMTDVATTPPRVQVRNLSKTFELHILHGKRITGFDNVSFDVPEGAFLGIAGRSGSGKSSLLKCLYRTYLADSGEITYRTDEGHEVDLVAADDDSVLDLRVGEIGYVSQFLRPTPRVAALDLAARPMIRRGVPRKEAEERVAHYFQMLALPEDLWDGYPILFSGGEQQRVNLARALASDASLLLLDEPTSALDASLQDVVVQLIAERRDAGTTMIGIMHDAELLADLSDVIVHMAEGHVTSFETMGSPAGAMVAGR